MLSKSKKASMVITCYNKQDYIGRMLDSVIAQKYDNIEVIIVNDGSTDGSLEVINNYVPRLKQRGYEVIVVNQENMGRAPALKSGLQRVTGDFVCFPDGDDTLLEEYVSAPVEYMIEHEEVDFVVGDWFQRPCAVLEHPYLKSRNVCNINDLSNEQLLSMLLLGHNIWTVVYTAIIRMSYINKCGINENISRNREYTQETQIMLPLFLCGGKMHYLKKTIYDYDENTQLSVARKALASAKNHKEHNRRRMDSVAYILRRYDALTIERIIMFRLQNVKTYGALHCSDRELVIEILKHISINVSEETAFKIGFWIIQYWAANKICGIESNTDAVSIKTKEIIAYGVGKAAKKIINGLIASDIKPTAFWDAAAKEGDEISGVKVIQPNFDSLKDKDITVLILLYKIADIEAVTKSIYVVNPNTDILYYYDVVDYLANFYLDGKTIKLVDYCANNDDVI